MNTQIILLAAGAFIFGAGVSFLVMKLRLKTAEKSANDLIREAKRNIERERNQIILKAKAEWLQTRDGQEIELKKRAETLDEFEAQMIEIEKNINKREEQLKQKEHQLTQGENDIKAQRDALRAKDGELNRIIYAQNEELSKVSGLSLEDAKQKLLQNLKKEYRREAAEIYKNLVDETKNNASREAKKIITYAIEKLASEYASENTLAVVALPSEEVKGRIIGRDGRNIKSFETASGVKLIVDDTPEAVVISCFDPVQREIARLALEKLVANGKIHPHRIEEALKQSEQEVEKNIWRAGNEMIASIGVGKIHPDLIRTLGKLHYRTSYGKNVLKHSKEVDMLCGAMAAELKLDTKLARRAGLMHDIGKAVSQSQEGTHTQLGEELCKQNNESQVVLNAIASHHEDVPADNLYSVLVAAADSISGSRPGARRDTLDGYIRRIESLEKLADSFEGVEKSYAISAGREVRVIVQPEKISDAEADLLSAEIAKKVQDDLDYPGQVKITVIRMSKSVAYA